MDELVGLKYSSRVAGHICWVGVGGVGHRSDFLATGFFQASDKMLSLDVWILIADLAAWPPLGRVCRNLRRVLAKRYNR